MHGILPEMEDEEPGDRGLYQVFQVHLQHLLVYTSVWKLAEASVLKEKALLHLIIEQNLTKSLSLTFLSKVVWY